MQKKLTFCIIYGIIICRKKVSAMRKIEYSFLDNGMLPSGFINITSDIAYFKASSQIRQYEYSTTYNVLKKQAILNSVKSSNAIEGIYTTDERLSSIVNRNDAPQTHSEEELIGYKNALDSIHQGYKFIDFTENSIKRLHRTMLNIPGYENIGEYKQEDNVITETYDGKTRIAYIPVSAKETPEAMKQLILAYEEAANNPRINRLILIPCVILDFLCIHPFNDGNGRISRLLSLLLLYKEGHNVVGYISFERQIEKIKSKYYEALQKSSLNWEKGANDYFPFIENFLTCLYMSYKDLDIRFGSENQYKKATKSERIQGLIDNMIIPVSKSEICEMLPDISPTTVESVLGNMVKNNEVSKIGQGKNTKYIKK